MIDHCAASGKKQPQHYPVLDQIVDGDTDQQQASYDVDDVAVPCEQGGELTLERSGKQGKNQQWDTKSQPKP